MNRVRHEIQEQDYRALIQRPGEKPFDARIVENVYYELMDRGMVESYTAEGCVYDNDGQLVPLSQVEGLIAVMDPGEGIADILQPKKQAKRKRRLRYLEFVGKAIGVARG